MKKSDVKIGMKVVPVRKTAKNFKGLPNSTVWHSAKTNGRKFLYVIGWEEEERAWQLSLNKKDDPSYKGDFFKSCDFRPYTGE